MNEALIKNKLKLGDQRFSPAITTLLNCVMSQSVGTYLFHSLQQRSMTFRRLACSVLSVGKLTLGFPST